MEPFAQGPDAARPLWLQAGRASHRVSPLVADISGEQAVVFPLYQRMIMSREKEGQSPPWAFFTAEILSQLSSSFFFLKQSEYPNIIHLLLERMAERGLFQGSLD